AKKGAKKELKMPITVTTTVTEVIKEVIKATIIEVIKEVIKATITEVTKAITTEVIAIKVELITAIGKATTIEKATIVTIGAETIITAVELDYIVSDILRRSFDRDRSLKVAGSKGRLYSTTGLVDKLIGTVKPFLRRRISLKG
ncbi:MAG: hypothetical protein Q9226_002141, partial [Calogaya cf. arnoldii]